MDDEFEAAKTKVIQSSKNKFKFKGNETQYNFNEKQKEGVEKAVSKIQKGESAAAVADLEQVIKDINYRNKLIKLADKSDLGWKVVEEYEKDDLAENSGDEKRIKKSFKDAEAKNNNLKRKKAFSARRVQCFKRSAPIESPSSPFYPGFRRSTQMQGAGFRQARVPKPTDICFACGRLATLETALCRPCQTHYRT